MYLNTDRIQRRERAASLYREAMIDISKAEQLFHSADIDLFSHVAVAEIIAKYKQDRAFSSMVDIWFEKNQYSRSEMTRTYQRYLLALSDHENNTEAAMALLQDKNLDLFLAPKDIAKIKIFYYSDPTFRSQFETWLANSNNSSTEFLSTDVEFTIRILGSSIALDFSPEQMLSLVKPHAHKPIFQLAASKGFLYSKVSLLTIGQDAAYESGPFFSVEIVKQLFTDSDLKPLLDIEVVKQFETAMESSAAAQTLLQRRFVPYTLNSEQIAQLIYHHYQDKSFLANANTWLLENNFQVIFSIAARNDAAIANLILEYAFKNKNFASAVVNSRLAEFMKPYGLQELMAVYGNLKKSSPTTYSETISYKKRNINKDENSDEDTPANQFSTEITHPEEILAAKTGGLDYAFQHKALPIAGIECRHQRLAQEDRVDLSEIPGFALLSPEDQNEIIYAALEELQSKCGQAEMEGSCVLINIITEEEIITVSLGDSTAFLVEITDETENATLLNQSLHNPHDSQEQERLEKFHQGTPDWRRKVLASHGKRLRSEYFNEDGKCIGYSPSGLALSGAVGDKAYESTGLTHRPNIIRTQRKFVEGTDYFLITACDGMTEGNFTENAIAKVVGEYIHTDDELIDITTALLYEAIAAETTDNLSIIVTKLSSGELFSGPDDAFSIGVFDGHGGPNVAEKLRLDSHGILCELTAEKLEQLKESKVTNMSIITGPRLACVPDVGGEESDDDEASVFDLRLCS